MLKKIYIFVLLGLLFGSFTLNPLFILNLPFGRFRANDLVIVFQVLFSFVYFVRKRAHERIHDRTDNGKKLAFFYFVMVLLMTLVSKAEVTDFGGNEFIGNIRYTFYFASFFFVLSLLSKDVEEKFLINCMLIHAVAASFLTIAQSLYGPVPLFGASLSIDSDMSSFYNVSTWNQFDSIGSILTRVNLPTIELIVWAFLYMVIEMTAKANLGRLFLMGLFSLVIFINYARGLFAGVILALFVFFFFVNRKDNIGLKMKIKFIVKVLITAGFLLLAMSIIFGADVSGILWDRFTSASQDLSESQGTWQFRMNELEAFKSMDFGWREILFGYGLFPQHSLIGLTTIHFGWGDLLYRGGIVFGMALIIYVIMMLKYLIKKYRYSNDNWTASISKSLFLYIIVLIGFFSSANHLWSYNAYAVIGILSAIIYKRSCR